MKILLIITFTTLLSCNNSKENSPTPEEQKIEELSKKVEELTEKEKQEKEQKEKNAAHAKAKELQDKKDLIIAQIQMGEGIISSIKHDPVGTGGINNGTITIENALSGVTFQIIKVETTVYLDNGKIYNSEQHTFTNLKPGDARTRNIANTGSRGTRCEARVIEIQSNWLTDGKIISL